MLWFLGCNDEATKCAIHFSLELTLKLWGGGGGGDESETFPNVLINQESDRPVFHSLLNVLSQIKVCQC